MEGVGRELFSSGPWPHCPRLALGWGAWASFPPAPPFGFNCLSWLSWISQLTRSLASFRDSLREFGAVCPIVSTSAAVETKMQAPAHLIRCINHSDVITFVISFLRVLAKHARVWAEIPGMSLYGSTLAGRAMKPTPFQSGWPAFRP